MAEARVEAGDRLTHAARTESAPGAVVAAAFTPISLDVIESVDDMLRLGAEWRRLHEESLAHRSVFQSFDWLSRWLATQTPCNGGGLVVIAGRREGRLVFIWPLMKCRSGPLNLLRWLSEPYGQYGDVLVGRGECPRAWMADALARIQALPGIDALRLRHVRNDAAAAPFLRDRFRDAHFRETAPFLDLTQFVDEQAYEARYTGQQRKRRKKIRKDLEYIFGPVTFTLLEPGPAADAAIEQAIAEKSRWIEARGRQNRVLSSEELVPFLKALSRSEASSMRLVLSELSAGGRPVSWEIGLRTGGVHYAFITSHVAAYTDYSPGRLHMDLSQRRALADGMTAFDLMLPHDAYKDSWSSELSEVRDYHLPLSPAGHLYGQLYLERVRPVLRDVYYRLPSGVLRVLKPIFRH